MNIKNKLDEGAKKICHPSTSVDKTVDYDELIKLFCKSVLNQLRARRPRDTTERHDVAVAIARFDMLLKDPEKYTTWQELYENRADLVGLCVPGNKYGEYDRWLYIKTIDILANITEYYKLPENEDNKMKLESSIREYFVGASRNPLQHIYCRVMPMYKVIDMLQKQK